MITTIRTDPAPTLDDVWCLFKANEEAAERRSQEAEKRSREFEERFQAEQRAARIEMQELKELSKQSDQRFEETRRELREQMKNLNIQLGNLGNRLGEFVEEQVMPSALSLIQTRGIAVHEIHRRVNAKRKGQHTEIDLLLVNDTEIVAIEVKSSLSVAYVDQHVKRLNNFKLLFPHYAKLRIFGAVAGMVVPDDAKERGLEQGLFVLIPANNMMQLANDPAFTPREW